MCTWSTENGPGRYRSGTVEEEEGETSRRRRGRTMLVIVRKLKT